jgi:Flp pilus assembly protein TadD
MASSVLSKSGAPLGILSFYNMPAPCKSLPAKVAAAKPSPWESRWFPWLAGGLLVLAGLAAYGNSFSGPFIFDDELWITGNPTIRHLWPVWPVMFPAPGTIFRGRPVLNLSLAANYTLSGLDVWSYHAMNLTTHLIAGLALFGLVRRTLLRPAFAGLPPSPRLRWTGRRADPSGPNPGAGLRFVDASWLALAVAALWMLHPLQTESVTYVIQRAESLMGMFYLLTLYCFVRSVDAEGVRHQDSGVRIQKISGLTPSVCPLSSVLWSLASVFFCLLGMATKEVMVSAPLIVLLYDRTFVAGSFREAWRKRWRVHLSLAATWLELGGLMAGIGGRGAGFSLGITWQTYALTECPVVAHYLWLAVCPHPLVLDYGEDVVRHAADAMPYALLLAVPVAGTALALWRWPAWGFAGAWIFGILAATSSFVPVAYQPMAEHRMYLPLAGVVAVAVLGIYSVLGRRSLVVFLALAIGLGCLTARRNEDYRSDLAIWTDTVEKRPGNPRAQNYLALTLAHHGRLAEALGHFQEATHFKADFAEAYNNTGTCLVLLGRAADAVGPYEQALVYKHDFPEAQSNLGDALLDLGRYAEAAQHYEEAVRLKPDYLDARLSLAAVWERMGRMTEAVGQYQDVLRYDPGSVKAREGLARLRAQDARPGAGS